MNIKKWCSSEHHFAWLKWRKKRSPRLPSKRELRRRLKGVKEAQSSEQQFSYVGRLLASSSLTLSTVNKRKVRLKRGKNPKRKNNFFETQLNYGRSSGCRRLLSISLTHIVADSSLLYLSSQFLAIFRSKHNIHHVSGCVGCSTLYNWRRRWSPQLSIRRRPR